jgi:hypothetical protein
LLWFLFSSIPSLIASRWWPWEYILNVSASVHKCSLRQVESNALMLTNMTRVRRFFILTLKSTFF